MASSDRYSGTKVAELSVLEDWIDFNGHMNVAYYVLAFDSAIDGLWERLGMDANYRDSTTGSTFAAESHVRYLRELKQGDPIIITAQIVAHDEKRLHQFQRMYHARDQYLAATCEWMNLHVNLTTRKVSPWPANIEAAIAAFANLHADEPAPEGLGAVMHVPRRIESESKI